jgi:heme/copper-type cytochrome/quinol oxidase subunit 2
MTQKQTTIIITFAVVVLVGVVVGLSVKRNGGSELPGGGNGGNVPATTSGSKNEPTQPAFSNNVPQNTQPTTPVKEVNASASGGAKVLTFNISISKNGASPADINVKKGSSVEIFITSADGDYDWSVPYIGYYQFVKKGGQGKVAFDATLAGTYSIECRDHCPASGNIYGKLIVIP